MYRLAKHLADDLGSTWKSTGWMVRGSNSGRDKRFFYTPNRPHRPCVPPSGHWVSFWRLKRTGREVSHSAPCSTEVKNERSFISALPKCLHDVDRENFTIYLYRNVCKIINTVTHLEHAYITEIHVSRLVYCGQEFTFGIYTNVLP